MPGRAPLGLSRGARLARVAAGVRLAAIVSAVLTLLAAPVAVLAVRRAWMTLQAAQRVLVDGALPTLALLAIVAGLLAAALALFAFPRRGFAGALIAVAVGALVYAGWVRARAGEASHPPVHDVSTDWRDPPMPTPRLLAQRGPKALPIEVSPAVPEGPGVAAAGGFLGRQVAEVNARTCPAAVPATLAASAAAAYAQAKAAVLAQRMTLVTDDPTAGVLEATARRGVYALADDLMLRVRPEGAGARIDMRSIARQGLGDGGANCGRLTRLRGALAR